MRYLNNPTFDCRLTKEDRSSFARNLSCDRNVQRAELSPVVCAKGLVLTLRVRTQSWSYQEQLRTTLDGHNAPVGSKSQISRENQTFVMYRHSRKRNHCLMSVASVPETAYVHISGQETVIRCSSTHAVTFGHTNYTVPMANIGIFQRYTNDIWLLENFEESWRSLPRWFPKIVFRQGGRGG